jgi:hypothetical protein
VVASLTALLVTTLSSAAFTGQLLGNRNRERAQAMSRYVADESRRLRGYDVSLSMQLALGVVGVGWLVGCLGAAEGSECQSE